MPELPDVEVFRRRFGRTSLHRKIEAVRVRKKRVLKGTSASGLGRSLKGDSFEKTERRGKHMFAGTKKGTWLAIHFGMTGTVAHFKDGEEEPEYSAVVFCFRDGTNTSYISKRMLGRLRVIGSPDDFIRGRGLGPDALDIGKKEFIRSLSGKSGRVKTAIMDQSLLAGVGNIYADEILFQAGVRPDKSVKKMGDRELGRIYGKMKRVLKKAIEKKARPERFPKSFIIPERGKRGSCPRCGARVKHIRISSRASYFCPECQSK